MKISAAFQGARFTMTMSFEWPEQSHRVEIEHPPQTGLKIVRKLLIAVVAALPLLGVQAPAQARGGGGAIAAGIIGGLALGGLAAAAAQPRYAYPYPVYGYSFQLSA